MKFLPLQERANLIQRLHHASALKGHFVLRSGAKVSDYFDKYQFESDPTLLRRLARLMAGLIGKDSEILAGLELGGIPLATAISLETGLPAVFVRKQAKEYGTCRAVEGPSVMGKSVVVVEDVITTGGQVIDSVQKLRNEGAKVDRVLCVIWRGNDLSLLKNAGLTLRWVVTPAEMKMALSLAA
jgi:orotate phosphoribosyltransferase